MSSSEMAAALMTSSELSVQKEEAAGYGAGDERKEEFHEVGIYVWVDRVANVDVVSQTFEAEFDLLLVWNTTEAELQRFTESPNDFVPEWMPQYRIQNGRADQTVVSSRVLSENGVNSDYYGAPQDFKHRSHPILVEYVQRCHGTFQEQFELENFPLDCQDLQLNFELMEPLTTCIFHPLSPKRMALGYNGDSAGILLSNCVITGYIPYNQIFFEFYTNSYGGGGRSNTFSVANLKFKLARVWAPYFWKVGLVLMITSGCTLLAFALDEGFADQLGLLFTLLLTVVAFQFVAASYVPNLDYLTYLDHYVAASFMFVFVVIAIVSVLNILGATGEVEVYAGTVLFGVFVLMHIAFVVKAVKARKFELAKLDMDCFDYYNMGYEDAAAPEKFVCWGVDSEAGPYGIAVCETHKEMLKSSAYSFLGKGKSKNKKE